MAEVTTNYFVCTLGEAAQPSIRRPYSNVNNLITKQGKENPDLPAIGFHVSSGNSKEGAFETRVLTFDDVCIGTATAASLLSTNLEVAPGKAVGLLADSSPAFLFTWLGCIKLGHPVLLLAPQLAASAIAHLCKACDVSVLLTDKKHENLALQTCQQKDDSHDAGLRSMLMPFTDDQILFQLIERNVKQETPELAIANDSIAYLHHTSGTSSGLPKPIPQTHQGAIGVLPALDGRQQATFTTTPLYHGGPADIFRAWTSNAMIWLFPSKDIPITASNIGKCLEAAESLAQSGQTSPVKYFTSVPYVLQMMAVDVDGLKWLQKMDLVGVGGAALPAKVGDELVEQGVRLVSRFGSAECGFLLSSCREYEKDKDWQYLRINQNSPLVLESREEGLHELVVKPEWPHLAKRNRNDGSYATADLFEKHATISNAWRYHSRADSQLTLITGKKFDPAPTEHDIAAANDLISDVLLFGNGKPYPGALLFKPKNAANMSDKDLLMEIASLVEKINEGNQKHARIPRNMLVMMPSEEQPLEKSSKGTILRNKAEARYADVIEQAYVKVAPTSAEVTDEDVPKAILDLTISIVGHDTIGVEDDLFSQGVDSVACVQIRHGLSHLLPKDAKTLPLTVVEDSGTISELSNMVIKLRHGEIGEKSDDKTRISEIIKQYSQLDYYRPVETMIDGITTVIEPPGKTVLLTGATGSLGSHVLGQLLQTTTIQQIYVLVRGATPHAAKERVHKALSSRKLIVSDDFEERVTILQCKLSDPDLGLTFQDYSALQNEVDLVLHMAWSVNFLISLRSFAPHFAGIRNLLNLCLSSTKPKPPRFVFCSSVASVSNFSALQHEKSVPEGIQMDFAVSGSTGYAQSKLTAELILANAATNISSLRDRLTVVRVGQLSADSKHGIWSASEAYPQILATAKLAGGILPDLGQEERLTWLPVDVAAKAFVETSLTEPDIIGDMPTEHVKHELGKNRKMIFPLMVKGKEVAGGQEVDTSAVRVVHLLNPDRSSTFTSFLDQLQHLLHKESKETLKIVPVGQWLEKLEGLAGASEQFSEAQKSLRLLPFWKQTYADRQPRVSTPSGIDSSNASNHELVFDVHNSLIAMPALSYWLGLSTLEGRESRRKVLQVNGDASLQRAVDPVEKVHDDADNELLKADYVMKIWKWVSENVP